MDLRDQLKNLFPDRLSANMKRKGETESQSL